MPKCCCYCVLLLNPVRPRPAVPHEELHSPSIQSRTIIVLLSVRKERLCRWRGKLPLWETDGSLHTSKLKPHFWLHSKADLQTKWQLYTRCVKLCLSLCLMWCICCWCNLTFSSIPPLMTGSGSGPVGMKVKQESVIGAQRYNSFALSGGLMSCHDTCSPPVLHHSSTLLDQESFCSSPFIPPTPTLLHRAGMSRSSIIHTWVILYEMMMVLLLVLYTVQKGQPGS